MDYGTKLKEYTEFFWLAHWLLSLTKKHLLRGFGSKDPSLIRSTRLAYEVDFTGTKIVDGLS
jgi:hypothetical protein